MKIIQFIKDAIQEFRHITWPKGETLRHHTMLVLGFVLVFGAIMAILDFAFGSAYTELTKNIQPKPAALSPARTSVTAEATRATPTAEASGIKAVDENGKPINSSDIKITPVNTNTTVVAPSNTNAR